MTVTQRLPISVCLIAGDEAQRIRRALDSVAGWAGEIIVVINDDVTDGTDKIAESYHAKVFRESWKGHVAQKNSAADKASQPWILGLDADEEVSAALRDEIRRAVVNPGDGVAFSFPRCTFFCGRWIRHGDWYPDRQTRLWLRGRGHWSGTDPHDKLVVEGRARRLHGDLLHYTAETLDRQIGKIAVYAEAFVRNTTARRRRAGGLALLVRPAWRFLRSYVLRLGFLDGWQGCYIAWMTAFYAATRYAKVNAAQQQKNKSG